MALIKPRVNCFSNIPLITSMIQWIIKISLSSNLSIKRKDFYELWNYSKFHKCALVCYTFRIRNSTENKITENQTEEHDPRSVYVDRDEKPTRNSNDLAW